MRFERRVAVAAASAVAVAVILAALASYLSVRQELRSTVDKSLRTSLSGTQTLVSGHFTHRPGSGTAGRTRARRTRRVLTRDQRIRLLLDTVPNRFGQPGVVEAVLSNGTVLRARGVSAAEAPVTTDELADLASSGKGTTIFTVQRRGGPYRVLAAGVVPGVAVVIERSLSQQDATLSQLRVILLLVAAAGIALAALLGWFVARTTLAPVRRLTAAAEHVAATTDLAARIEDSRRDELGSLAHSFNAMLAALDVSARAQRQLIADASHELRTPVTSLRTNIEILEHADDLAPDERERLIHDVVGQLEGLSGLVSDLIELAREDQIAAEPLEEVRLDVLVRESVERVQLFAPQASFDVELEETLVSAVPSRLGRAVSNLLENAVKYAGTDEPIEVRLHDGELAIRDHGPGIDPEELPHVFDRFFRGAGSRALPGSGLGLAIVRQVVERHSGTVSASAAPGGGTVVRLRMPVLS
ncbi:MAG: HAMP domain-containing sensor histidine kinase [Solirubrobacteraceae bacterium]|jgi:two-component system sensor histidine kinase MprB